MAFVCWAAAALAALWCCGEWCDIPPVDCGTFGGGGAATPGGIDWCDDIVGIPGECCDCIDWGGADCCPDCEFTDEGDVGGEAIKWLGECKSGEPICIGGFIDIGGCLGTAVMLANKDWKEVEGEYMEAIPGGNICGGPLKI